VGSIDENAGNSRRRDRHTMLALCAFGFLLSLTACNTRISESDLREGCKNTRSCVGESEFGYQSIEACVDDEMDYYNQYEGECRKNYARVINCYLSNFECKNGSPRYPDCEDQEEAFRDSDCDGPRLQSAN
jgi:hypothetical protein